MTLSVAAWAEGAKTDHDATFLQMAAAERRTSLRSLQVASVVRRPGPEFQPVMSESTAPRRRNFVTAFAFLPTQSEKTDTC